MRTVHEEARDVPVVANVDVAVVGGGPSGTVGDPRAQLTGSGAIAPFPLRPPLTTGVAGRALTATAPRSGQIEK